MIPILWLERGSHFFFQVDEMLTASAPYYYDLKGRVTKQVRTNLLGGADVTTTAYTLTDKPASVMYTHTGDGKTTRTGTYGYADDKNSHLAKDLNKDQCFYFFNFILLLIVCKRFFFVNRFIYGLR